MGPAVTTFTHQSLPEGDNVNPYAFSIALSRPWFMAKGAMIAYYGTVDFQGVNSYANVAAWVASQFSSPLYAQEWVVATGQGKVLVADRHNDLNSYDLEDGNLTIRATNLLAFDSGLELKQSIVPGFLTLLGTGTFIASSNGPVIFVEPPFRADPEALLGWADCPAPCHHHDAQWMQASLVGAVQGMFGRRSGEERQFDFTGQGTILLQSSEVGRLDPALVRLVTAQTDLLTPPQAGVLGQQLVARAQQAQQQG